MGTRNPDFHLTKPETEVYSVMNIALLTIASTVTEKPEDLTLGFITLIGGIFLILFFFWFISKWL